MGLLNCKHARDGARSTAQDELSGIERHSQYIALTQECRSYWLAPSAVAKWSGRQIRSASFMLHVPQLLQVPGIY